VNNNFISKQLKTLLALLLTLTFFISNLSFPSKALAESTGQITYPSDYKLIEVPDPLVGNNPLYKEIEMKMPDAGKSYFEPNFGTILTKATVEGDYGSIEGRHEYSRFDPFNKDHSMIVLNDSRNNKIYKTDTFPYNQESNLVCFPSPRLSELRWDPQDPNIMWGLQRACIIKLNVLTGEQTIVKDFSEDAKIGEITKAGDYSITTEGEGESSIDKRYWALFLKNATDPACVFTYDLVEDKVIGLYKLSSKETNINWVGMSSKGGYVVFGGETTDPSYKFVGTVIANKEMTKFKTISMSTSHSDIGLDTEGNEVLVIGDPYKGTIDMVKLGFDTKGITDPEQSFKGSGCTPLITISPDAPKFTMTSTYHISANAPGYCVISASHEPDAEEGYWFDSSIVLVKLDPNNPRVFYLSKIYNVTVPSPRWYWDEVHATISSDGLKLVWACNWNLAIGQEKIFLMQVDLPENWQNNLPVQPPKPTPKPKTTKIKVNNKYIDFKYAPIKVSGVILAQASTFAKALGATSKYDSKKHSITITKGKTKILFTIGSKKAKIGSKSYVLSAALKLSVVPFVPVKFIAERFGYKYSFNSVTGVITIKK
jgi:hypothetical protein